MCITCLLVCEVKYISYGRQWSKKFEKDFSGEIHTSETLKKQHRGEKTREKQREEKEHQSVPGYLPNPHLTLCGRTIPFYKWEN